MAETILLDPSAVATGRSQLDITPFISEEGVDYGDAAIEAYMSDSSRGATPVDYRIPNRTITIPLVLLTKGGVTFETIRRQVQAKVALFQRWGGWMSRQTSVGTLYIDVVNATLKLGGDWFQANRSFDTNAVLTLECIPDFYGAEIALDDITATSGEIITPLKLSAANAVISGDYPARVRILVDNDGSTNQLGLLWGLRSHYYSAASTAPLKLEAEAGTPLDTAVSGTLSGASGGSAVTHPQLIMDWLPIWSTQGTAGGAHLTHVGTYTVWARVQSTATTSPSIRFKWDVGDLAFPVTNPAVTLPAAPGQYYLINLGQVRLAQVPVGTHRWQGTIEAKANALAGTGLQPNISIDKIWFQPTDEGSGRVVSSTNYVAGAAGVVARDSFNQTTGALSGKTMPVGGTWATAGDAEGFVVAATASSLFTGNQIIKRSAAAGDVDTNTGHYALAGTTTYTNVTVQARETFSSTSQTGTPPSMIWYDGVIARYVDTNNWIMAYTAYDLNNSIVYRRVYRRVAGTVTGMVNDTALAWVDAGLAQWTLSIQSNGHWSATFTNNWHLDTATSSTWTGTSSVLATGGALASGRVGIYEYQSVRTGATSGVNAIDQEIDELIVTVDTAADAALFANQSAELRHDGIYREDSTGSAFSSAPRIIGDLPRLPPSGLEATPVELFLKSSRGDFDQSPDSSATENISARVFYRPSWLIAPG